MTEEEALNRLEESPLKKFLDFRAALEDSKPVEIKPLILTSN